MDRIERMRELLKKQYGIASDERLIDAIQRQRPIDIGIFVSSCGRKEEVYGTKAG